MYRGGTYGRYISTGHLLFVNKDTIFAAPFDIRSLEVTGSPSPVVQEVSYSQAEGSAQLPWPTMARSSTAAAAVRRPVRALWVDERGEGSVWDGERSYGERISPGWHQGDVHGADRQQLGPVVR